MGCNAVVYHESIPPIDRIFVEYLKYVFEF
jgi:hypothetical protein